MMKGMNTRKRTLKHARNESWISILSLQHWERRISSEIEMMLGVRVTQRFSHSVPYFGTRISLVFCRWPQQNSQRLSLIPICRNKLNQRHFCYFRSLKQIKKQDFRLSFPACFRNLVRELSSNSNKIVIEPKSNTKRLLELAKPEKWNLIGAVLLLMISSTVTLSVPFCIGKVIDIITSLSGDELAQKLGSITQILIGVFLVGAAANAGRVYLTTMAAQRIINNLRSRIYNSLLKQEIGFFDVTRTGELISRLSTDTKVVGLSLTNNMSDGLRSAFATIAGLSMMVYSCPKLTMLGLAIVPPVAILAVIYGRFVKIISRSVQDCLAQTTEVASERISNIRTVRAFAQEDAEIQFFDSKIRNILALAKKEALARSAFFGMTGLSGNIIILTVLHYGGLMMSDSLLTMGQLSAFLMYAGYVGISIGGLSTFYSELMQAIGASYGVWQLLDREPQIPVKGGLILPKLKGEIVFKDVVFSYPNRPEVPVLQNLYLVIPPGSVTAIVGGSGSGKSTIGALLLRFYEVNSGIIFVDGEDIESLDPSWLRKQIAVVSQEPMLFSSSIRDNVLYGALEPELVTEEMIIQALKESRAWDFVQFYPQKLDTQVGERGVMLSGGQKQRIAIARALIRDPRILILDEATSALDTKKEWLVQEALELVMKGRTVITIAHRLSTIRKAHQIAVLSHNGKFVEIGTFSELMSIPNGLFRRLVERQAVLDDS